MCNLLNRIIFHRHEILVDYSQLAPTLSILNEFDITWKERITFGNCGWRKAPTCWFVFMTISDHKWYNVLKRFKEEGIDLLPPTIGY